MPYTEEKSYIYNVPVLLENLSYGQENYLFLLCLHFLHILLSMVVIHVALKNIKAF